MDILKIYIKHQKSSLLECRYQDVGFRLGTELDCWSPAMLMSDTNLMNSD